MSWSQAQTDRNSLYLNLSLLEQVSEYGSRPYTSVAAPKLPGLTPHEQDFVASPAGQAAIAVWWKVFAPTVRLLQQFRAKDQSRTPDETDNDPAYVDDLGHALRASQTAINAAVTRLQFLAAHVPGGDQAKGA